MYRAVRKVGKRESTGTFSREDSQKLEFRTCFATRVEDIIDISRYKNPPSLVAAPPPRNRNRNRRRDASRDDVDSDGDVDSDVDFDVDYYYDDDDDVVVVAAAAAAVVAAAAAAALGDDDDDVVDAGIDGRISSFPWRTGLAVKGGKGYAPMAYNRAHAVDCVPKFAGVFVGPDTASFGITS